MSKLLRLLEADCTLTHEQLASMAGMTVDEVRKEIKQYEDDKVILGYKAIVDWDRVRKETAPSGSRSPPSLRLRSPPSGGTASTGWPSVFINTTRWRASTS